VVDTHDLAVFLGPPPTLMTWSLNQLHDAIASSGNTLNRMKGEMTRSAERYVEQEAYVLSLAPILNQTALDAETGHSVQERPLTAMADKMPTTFVTQRPASPSVLT
jgi:hypothetical protein